MKTWYKNHINSGVTLKHLWSNSEVILGTFKKTDVLLEQKKNCDCSCPSEETDVLLEQKKFVTLSLPLSGVLIIIRNRFSTEKSNFCTKNTRELEFDTRLSTIYKFWRKIWKQKFVIPSWHWTLRHSEVTNDITSELAQEKSSILFTDDSYIFQLTIAANKQCKNGAKT